YSTTEIDIYISPFYADDAMFIGEWSDNNLKGGRFYWMLNIEQSVLISRRDGRRLTLLKSVLGASPIYAMSIFTVPRGVLKALESIRNRFFNGADQSDHKITWVAWDKVDSHQTITLRIGGRYYEKFISLKIKVLIFGIEQHMLEELTSMLETVSLSNSSDRWICDLTSDGVFRVKEVQNCIDDIFLPSQVIDNRWVRFVPIKVNIFIWRARQDCLSTRVNLVRRGINVDSCVCPICSTGEDELNHILFLCDLAQ
nr:RNA-directed DNA polymerase, eukaryota [Tanacetum cinerariifolium]